MSEKIILEGGVDPLLMGQVHALANGIKRVGEESEKLAGDPARGAEVLGRETAKAAEKASHLSVSLRGVGEAARHINEIRTAVVSFGEGLLSSARGVAALAAEQQNINANSADLRLNFARAAQGAGGFVTELQTMQLATNLANRNIRLTQTELDALVRVGMARASASGQDLNGTLESLADSIVEGGEEIGKFGQELLRVQDDTHTASERLGALVQRAREVPASMRTAADEVAHFEQSLRQAGRYISTGFVEETARLSSLGPAMRNAATDAEEARREMDALGRTAAHVLQVVGNLGGIVVGAVAMSVRGLAGAFEGVYEALRTRSMAGLRTGTAGAASDLSEIERFIENRITALSAIGADSESRSVARVAPAPAAGSTPADLVISAQELGIDPRTGRPIQRPSTSSGASARPARPSLDDLIGRAWERTGARAELPTIAGEQTPEQLRASTERMREDIRQRYVSEQRKAREELARGVGAQRTGAANSRSAARVGQEAALADLRDPAVQAEAEADRALSTQVERERAQSEERLRVQESFADQWERLHRRQASATTAFTETASGAISKFGDAFGKHINLIIAGQESVGEGVLNMVGEVVMGIGQEAIVKGAMELAEGIAAAAGVFTAPLAPGHFAAAAAFGAVGVAALGAGAILGSARGGGGAASAPVAPALPPPTQADAAPQGQSITIVYGAGILGSPRDLARHVRDVLDEGEQAGVRLPARVVERAA